MCDGHTLARRFETEHEDKDEEGKKSDTEETKTEQKRLFEKKLKSFRPMQIPLKGWVDRQSGEIASLSYC